MPQAAYFQAKWTDRIHDEWTRNVLANRPDLKPEQLEKTRRLMDVAVPDARVESYEWLIDSVKLPDADDRHVLAAAIRSQATAIVTFNLRDFPAKALRPHSIEAIHPDEFILGIIRTDAAGVLQAARSHRARLRNPPKSPDEYVATLAAQGLRKTSAFLGANAFDI